jgi:hypothetical protein
MLNPPNIDKLSDIFPFAKGCKIKAPAISKDRL